MRDNIYVALALVFLPMSLMSVGGGQSVIPDVHRQVVQGYQWITEAQFVTDYAISRMAPGPGSLIAALIGYHVAGLAGAVVASVAIFLPSSLLVYGLARIWARYRGAPWQRAVEAGLAPVAAGLILAAALTLFRAAPGGWLAIGVGLATALVVFATEINPLVPLTAGAGLFLLLGS